MDGWMIHGYHVCMHGQMDGVDINTKGTKANM